MSCAEVCLDHDYDGWTEFLKKAKPVSREERRCDECPRTIRRGEKYERMTGKTDGDFWTATTCLRCAEIREAFVCDSFEIGRLWESIEEGMFPIWNEKGPHDCLAKLETREARDYIRQRYDVWSAELEEAGA